MNRGTTIGRLQRVVPWSASLVAVALAMHSGWGASPAGSDPSPSTAPVEEAGSHAQAPNASIPQLAGQWRGQLTVSEEGKASELIVDLDLVGERWTGQFDLPDFGVEDYPVAVAIAGHTVTLQLSAAQIEFVGELDEATDLLAGMAEARGHRDSLALRRVGDAQLSEEFLRLKALSGDSTRVEHLSADGAELRRQFNQDRSYTRLLMLLSPT